MFNHPWFYYKNNIRLYIYIYIALKGKGKIIIADAPLQKCDFLKVTIENGTRLIVDYYKKHGIKIELIDFRKERAITDSSGRIKGIEKLNGDPRGYTVVDLGEDSLLHDIIDDYKKFRVTNYNPNLMKLHHNHKKNEYLIPNTILEVDVIINLPKPKTHRKAGITGAMKNLVSINGLLEIQIACIKNLGMLLNVLKRMIKL